MITFKASNRNQPFLMPPSINDWLPKRHLARFVVEIVEVLDLNDIYKEYNKGGKDAYDPRAILSLIFYGYATGVFSSRKIEQATYDQVPFRYISANTHPDHDTIANFRKRFLPQISDLFVQILSIAQEAGLLKVGKISLDGTKVKANASKHKALSYGHIKKLQDQLETEVETLLKKAQEADNMQSDDGLNIPEEIERREDRLQVIKEAKEKIEARAAERYKKEKALYDEKMNKREAKEKLSGKKPRGKKPKVPVNEVQDKDQVNLTDEESRIMKTSGGGFEQCYNAQASADHDSRLILHTHVTQNSNDKQEIEPTMKWYELHPQFKPSTAFNADAGYFSEENIKACEKNNMTPYISFGKEQHNQPLEERFKEADPLSPDPTSVEKMKHRLQTIEGKAIYAQRKSVIEPIFGIIKQVMGFRQFMLRGFKKAQGEWRLICMAYNLKRLHTIMG